MIEGERTYPIYRFWVKFSDNDHSVGNSRMFRELLTDEQAEQQLQEFIDHNLDAEREGVKGKYRIRDLGLDIVDKGWRFVSEDTWCLRWFNHYTFNVHLSDADLLASFQDYVNRHRAEQPGTYESVEKHRERVGNDWVCLMGAEDRWRWKGPCRCEHCTARGVVSIDH